jgi:hypothetical protein
MVALQLVAEHHLHHRFDQIDSAASPESARIRGRRLDHSLPARRQPCVEMSLDELRLDGLRAMTEQPLMWGERLIVQLPPRKGLPAWTAMGRVIRCEPCAAGYQINLEFESLHAA